MGTSPGAPCRYCCWRSRQLLLAGGRLGAVVDVVPKERYEPDVGVDPDADGLRERLAELIGPADEYVEVFDPYIRDGEIVHSRLSDDIRRWGNPSCEGGRTTGTHVHLARKYNGEWLPADETIPFVLSGYRVVAGEANYQGMLVKVLPTPKQFLSEMFRTARPQATAVTIIVEDPMREMVEAVYRAARAGGVEVG